MWQRRERTRHIRVKKAAMGCTIRRFVSELRALDGREKSAFDGSIVSVV